MSLGLKLMAVLSWLVAAAGLVVGLFVFVTDGYLDGSVGYDGVEVVSSLFLPFCATSIVAVICCFAGSLGRIRQCILWVLPSVVVVLLTVILVVIGCWPQA